MIEDKVVYVYGELEKVSELNDANYSTHPSLNGAICGGGYAPSVLTTVKDIILPAGYRIVLDEDSTGCKRPLHPDTRKIFEALNV